VLRTTPVTATLIQHKPSAPGSRMIAVKKMMAGKTSGFVSNELGEHS